MNDWIAAWYGMVPSWLDERHFTCHAKMYQVCQTELSEQELVNRYSCLNQQRAYLTVVPNLENHLLTQNWYLVEEDPQPLSVQEILSHQFTTCFLWNSGSEGYSGKMDRKCGFCSQALLKRTRGVQSLLR